MSQTRLSCDDVEALLPLVADGQLDQTTDPALFSHLADCPRCAESLADHDLITLALRRRPALHSPRPALRWHRWLPLAAAACVIVGFGVTVSFTRAEPQVVTPAVAQVTEPKIHPDPAIHGPAKISPPLIIEVEVVAVPGSTPNHPRYLVRRGEQILLVDPTAGPTDAVPASYSTPAPQQIRRY